MASIGNNPSIVINGRQAAYQGVSRLRKDVTTETAAAKTKGNGVDEMIISTRNANGRAERVIVYGDQLDFGFRKQAKMPSVTIDGRPATIVHFDDEATTFVEGLKRGATEGLRDAFDNASSTGRRVLTGVAFAGGATFVGSTALVAMSKGIGLESLLFAISKIGPKVAFGSGATALVALGVIAIGAAFREAFAAQQNRAKMETIAPLTTDANPDENAEPAPAPRRPAQRPVAQRPYEQPATAPRPADRRPIQAIKVIAADETLPKVPRTDVVRGPFVLQLRGAGASSSREGGARPERAQASPGPR